ncbi:MAG TPA: flagellar basal body rod protein FlgC [Buchnera sp. (in: enterobacteria)]|nr:flagellar basal body rod protein FlgC [Buchnera sp. (in: enterobacteria)]
MSLLNILNIAGSAMKVQSQKMQVCSNNIANIDSVFYKNGKYHPYIAQQVILKTNINDKTKIGEVYVDKIINDSSPCKLIYSPNNPMSDHNGYITTSNVNIITEMVNNIEASRNYQANIEIINNVKSMIVKTLTIGQ